MNSFDSAFEKVCKLVEDFKANEKRYLSAEYQEAEVRRDFIDKFFEALGWDVYHNIQKNPYEQEVKVEKGVSVGKAQKRADYAFYINPEFRDPKFFTEAKKPCRKLKNADDYFQTVRYGWNANTPVAVLTDFEEFHILDCRYKPDIDAVLQNQNNKIFNYADYANPEKFKEIYFLFSRNAVADGSLTKYSDALPKPKGKVSQWGLFKGIVKPIDEDFLEYIDDVRETLARAFKKNDSSLTSEQLTEVTQKTVDRLVFIRFLEDKLIEPEYYISELGAKSNIWKEFISLCKKLDAKYNGIVFKGTTIDKQDFQGPELIEFRKICEDISHLNSPYDFHYIPIHILGSIYERFLGKIVTLKGRGIKIEEKPEVRKAGGVYYTPKYIVDYIVKNSIGKLIENKTPEEISKLRFADIACGSGSFLIGVYDYLLEYHKAYYQKNIKKAEKDGCVNVNGLMTLSLSQKQNILLNNIYGVDIDHQAVEVTQFSLALKMLEDETTFTARQMQIEFRKKIIPEGLGNNIICGNSLIGTDIIYEDMTDGLFERKRRISNDEERKLNPMDFEKRFPEIMKSGGFDAIVGNPPYVRQESLSNLKNYFLNHFISYSGTADLYTYFIERAIKLLNNKGVISYIVSNKWMRSNYGKNLRKYLSDYNIIEIIDFGELPVFKNASTFPMIFLIEKNASERKTLYAPIKHLDFEDLSVEKIKIGYNLEPESLNINIYNLTNSRNFVLLKNIESKSTILGDYAGEKIYFGIKTGLNEAFIINQNIYEQLLKEDSRSKEIILPIAVGDDIRKYNIRNRNRYIVLTKVGIEIENYPAVFKYLSSFKTKLDKRWDKGNYWYELRPCAYYDKITSPKIVWPDIAKESRFAMDDGGYLIEATVFLLPRQDYFLLGLLNSKLIWYWLSNNCPVLGDPRKGGRLRLKTVYTSNIPIYKIDPTNTNEGSIKLLISSLAKQIIDTKNISDNLKTDKDKYYFENKCRDLDNAIDAEVYKLYGLTEEEIKIVEGVT